MEWMLLPLKRYFEWRGRSRRKEFWMFFLFTLLIGAATGTLDMMFGYGVTENGPIGSATSLAMLVPSITVAIRRLHDIDRSGWWLLLFFIPILGWIALLVFFVLEGNTGRNRFGDDPKNPTADIEAIFR